MIEKQIRCVSFILVTLLSVDVVIVQGETQENETWCTCTLLSTDCCLDLRKLNKTMKSYSPCQDKEKQCLCTNRTHFLENPFLQKHPYFLVFPELVDAANIRMFNDTPGLMVKQNDTGLGFLRYPRLLENEKKLRLLWKLKSREVNAEFVTITNSKHQLTLKHLIMEKGVEILTTLHRLGIITNISNLSVSNNVISQKEIPDHRIFNNVEFWDHYKGLNLSNNLTCRPIKTYTKRSPILTYILVALFVLFSICFFVTCYAIQQNYAVRA